MRMVCGILSIGWFQKRRWYGKESDGFLAESLDFEKIIWNYFSSAKTLNL